MPVNRIQSVRVRVGGSNKRIKEAFRHETTLARVWNTTGNQFLVCVFVNGIKENKAAYRWGKCTSRLPLVYHKTVSIRLKHRTNTC